MQRNRHYPFNKRRMLNIKLENYFRYVSQSLDFRSIASTRYKMSNNNTSIQVYEESIVCLTNYVSWFARTYLPENIQDKNNENSTLRWTFKSRKLVPVYRYTFFLSSLYPESTPTHHVTYVLRIITDVPFYHSSILTALFFTDSPREVYFIVVIKF